MTIALSRLKKAASQPVTKLAKSITEAKKADLRTIFLSHSHKDATYAQGLANLLTEYGMQAYIDWQDMSMPDKPDQVTASTIKNRIKSADLFMFLATPNSMQSRWCPWEIGYADGVMANEQIIIAQTGDGYHTYGSEYLDLYRSLDFSTKDDLAIWNAGSTTSAILIGNF